MAAGVAAGRCSVVKRGPSGSSVSALIPRQPSLNLQKRGDIKGWSRQSAARHCAFLQSVDPERLTGFGYALTHTLRDRPLSHLVWARFRRRMARYLRDLKVVRSHWVVEQAQKKRGGVPHLHLAVYFDHELTRIEIWDLKEAWCRIAKKCGARHQGQHVEKIRPGSGWSKYCAKHSARSTGHYQREGLPEGWEKTGRLWGKAGDWPVRIDRWFLNPAAVIEVRRLLRSWLVSDAVCSAHKIAAFRGRPVSWFGVRAARRLLVSDPEMWALRGIRAWVPEQVMGRIMLAAADRPLCFVAEILGDDGGDGWRKRLRESRDRARGQLGLPPPDKPDQPVFNLRTLEGEGPRFGPLTARQARIAELRQKRG